MGAWSQKKTPDPFDRDFLPATGDRRGMDPTPWQSMKSLLIDFLTLYHVEGAETGISIFERAMAGDVAPIPSIRTVATRATNSEEGLMYDETDVSDRRSRLHWLTSVRTAPPARRR